MPSSRPLPELAVALASAALLLAVPASAGAVQAAEQDGLRLGVTLGGISFLGVSVEYRWGPRSVDLNVGTWALRDLSVSVVGKQYLGPEGLRPYFGAGLWGVVAFPAEGSGSVLVLRAPIGVDWRAASDSFVGGAVSINRGLWVRRSDPADDTPLDRRLVPLPGFYYRWRP